MCVWYQVFAHVILCPANMYSTFPPQCAHIMHTSVCMCVCMGVCACVHVCAWVCVHGCMCMCAWVCVHVCAWVQTCHICSQLHIKWNAKNIELFHFKVHSNGGLVIPLKCVPTISAATTCQQPTVKSSHNADLLKYVQLCSTMIC